MYDFGRFFFISNLMISNLCNKVGYENMRKHTPELNGLLDLTYLTEKKTKNKRNTNDQETYSLTSKTTHLSLYVYLIQTRSIF